MTAHPPLPTHPRTGLTALGIVNGRPVWPVLGAEDPPAGDPPQDPPKTDPPKTDPPKTDPPPEKTFTQAELDRIVADRLQRERGKYADYNDLKAKAAKLDELEAANASDLEKAVKTARQEGESEATKRANGRLVASEARALAAQAKFRDASDAVRFLDLDDVKVADDGTVDADAISKQLEQLSKDKPYLLADEKPAAPKPDPSQGSGRTPAPVSGEEEGLAEAERRFGKRT